MGTVRSKPISVGIDTRPPSAREPLPSDALRTRSTALAAALVPLPLDQRLQLMRREVRGPIVFTTSFGLEDQAIPHALRHRARHRYRHPRHRPAVSRDLRRLDGDERRYGVRIRAVLSAARGGRSSGRRARDRRLLFIRSDARKACCDVRKVEPLARALAGAAVWVTGLRVEPVRRTRKRRVRVECRLGPRPSQGQPALRLVARRGARIHRASTTYRSTRCMRKGFLSIGCAPCTRAIAPGEPERAGRWWWEEERQEGMRAARRRRRPRWSRGHHAKQRA